MHKLGATRPRVKNCPPTNPGVHRKTVKNFLELAKARRSVRRYRPDPVPEELIEQVLEAARWAPSGMNMQPWEFVVLTDEELRRQIGRHAIFYGLRSPQVHQAPVVIAVCGHQRGRFVRDDCIFAGANLMLAAVVCGLSTCWVGGFREEPIKQMLGIPDELRPIGLMTLGYAEGEVTPPPKRDLKSMVHWQVYQTPSAGQRLREVQRWGPFSVLGRFLRQQLRFRR